MKLNLNRQQSHQINNKCIKGISTSILQQHEQTTFTIKRNISIIGIQTPLQSQTGVNTRNLTNCISKKYNTMPDHEQKVDICVACLAERSPTLPLCEEVRTQGIETILLKGSKLRPSSSKEFVHFNVTHTNEDEKFLWLNKL